MKRPYYLFNGGTMSRKDNTLCFVSDTVDEKGAKKPAKYIPIETASELFVFGALDANAALFNFLGQQIGRAKYYRNLHRALRLQQNCFHGHIEKSGYLVHQ